MFGKIYQRSVIWLCRCVKARFKKGRAGRGPLQCESDSPCKLPGDAPLCAQDGWAGPTQTLEGDFQWSVFHNLNTTTAAPRAATAYFVLQQNSKRSNSRNFYQPKLCRMRSAFNDTIWAVPTVCALAPPGHFSRFHRGDWWSSLLEIPLSCYSIQLIQFVTFWSPSWRSPFQPLKGSRFNHPKKFNHFQDVILLGLNFVTLQKQQTILVSWGSYPEPPKSAKYRVTTQPPPRYHWTMAPMPKQRNLISYPKVSCIYIYKYMYTHT